MLADLVDAVVGVDTHRDTHHVEIALPTGTPIATCSITNDTRGYAQLLAWILEHAPGPRIVVSIEGTRSYGIGLARALTAAGLLVLECEQPHRKTRRGKGKSDPIDAHLAVLSALRLDTTPAADSAGRRRPRSPAHLARRPPRPHRDQHRADQPAPCTTARRPRRH
jgi:transposase